MKLPKKFLLPFGFLFFFFAGIAFASSSQFLTQAQKYINKNCSKKNIDNQTALLCYLFNKVGEHDTAIANINSNISPIPSQIASLQNHTNTNNNNINTLQSSVSDINTKVNNSPSGSSKSIDVVDANGNVLGIFLSGNYDNNFAIFIPSVNKYAQIMGDHIYRGAMYYKSNDCTGTPYVPDGQTSPPPGVNQSETYQVFELKPNQFYVYDPNGTPSTGFHSMQGNGATQELPQCTNSGLGGILYGLPLIPITLPFSEPFVYPLQVRYQ